MITPLQLLGEFEDLVKSTPERPTARHPTPENLAWIGRASALVERWKPVKTVTMSVLVSQVHSMDAHAGGRAWTQILILLNQAYDDLKLETIGPTSAAISQGMTYDYFEEIRKVVASSATDAFFVDPYLDADFVARYLTSANVTVGIRLLTSDRRLTTLLPAVEAFAQQYGHQISVRTNSGLHDRYVLIDGARCFQSGASFKDGGRTAPTTITQITDAFDAVRSTYEALWASATVKR